MLSLQNKSCYCWWNIPMWLQSHFTLTLHYWYVVTWEIWKNTIMSHMWVTLICTIPSNKNGDFETMKVLLNSTVLHATSSLIGQKRPQLYLSYQDIYSWHKPGHSHVTWWRWPVMGFPHMFHWRHINKGQQVGDVILTRLGTY